MLAPRAAVAARPAREQVGQLRGRESPDEPVLLTVDAEPARRQPDVETLRLAALRARQTVDEQLDRPRLTLTHASASIRPDPESEYTPPGFPTTASAFTRLLASAPLGPHLLCRPKRMQRQNACSGLTGNCRACFRGLLGQAPL